MSHRKTNCEARDCYAPRSLNFRFCRRHMSRYNRSGHPNGRMIRRKELAPALDRAEELLTRYRERKAVRAALDWVSNLLTSYDTRELERSNHMQRLGAGGVTPWEFLKAVLAVWIYQEWNPEKLPSDVRLTHNLSNIVLRLAPLPRKPTPGGHTSERGASLRLRVQLGEMLRAVLFPLCGKMYLHDVAEYRRQQELKAVIANFGAEEG